MTGSPSFPRVQAIPQPGRASLCIDGIERVGYNFGERETRPFLYPLVGASGGLLTRMGHPNPIGHEHHKSIWFGHQSVSGVNFWEDKPASDIRIRHRRVRLYHDGPTWGGLVAELDWWARGRVVMRQELTIAIELDEDLAFSVDLQSRFEVAPSGEPVELGRTNFGLLGVRVSKTISEQFGGGSLTSSEGATGEPAIYGKAARWVDYSGPSAPGKFEGVCTMDHPSNPHFPSHWHVRRDGWMSAAFNLVSPHGLAKDHPLDLRYRLLVHSGKPNSQALDRAWDQFAQTPPYSIVPSRGQELTSLRRDPRQA